MKTALTSLTSLAVGLLAAQAPVANGLLLLIGLAAGVALTLVVELEAADKADLHRDPHSETTRARATR